MCHCYDTSCTLRKLLKDLQPSGDGAEGTAKGASRVRVLRGNATWTVGQLEEEIANGVWVVAQADAAALGLLGEGLSGRRLWSELLRAMGPPFADMARISPKLVRDLSELDVRASVATTH